MDDRRQHLRFPASWRVRIVCTCRKTGEQRVIEGKTCNISVAGVCMSSEHNMCPGKTFILELSVPPVMPGTAAAVVRFEARSRFSVLASDKNGFRTGINFVRLDAQAMRDLALYLERHHGTPALMCHSPCD